MNQPLSNPKAGSPIAPGSCIPYGRHWVTEEDVAAVIEVLRSDWLTTGPKVEEFEHAFARATGAPFAVGLASGTAALHACMAVLGIGPGDEVIVPAMTFAATANSVVFQGGTPRFADVEPDTLLVDPASVEALISPRTRAIVAVDYAGQPCDYDALRAIADRHGLALVADACHSLGATYKERPTGSLADLTAFSLHPVKPITAGEGGMVTTSRADWAAAIRRFRNHGISTDLRERQARGIWEYDMVSLGYNYRITDIQCALGLSQLSRLPRWVERRQQLAGLYDAEFRGLRAIRPLARRDACTHAFHLYVVRVPGAERNRLLAGLRERAIGVNIHYRPVHLHSFYRERFGTGPSDCPVAEAAYDEIVTLPLFPAMSDEMVSDIVRAVDEVLATGAPASARTGGSDSGR